MTEFKFGPGVYDNMGQRITVVGADVELDMYVIVSPDHPREYESYPRRQFESFYKPYVAKPTAADIFAEECDKEAACAFVDSAKQIADRAFAATIARIKNGEASDIEVRS